MFLLPGAHRVVCLADGFTSIHPGLRRDAVRFFCPPSAVAAALSYFLARPIWMTDSRRIAQITEAGA